MAGIEVVGVIQRGRQVPAYGSTAGRLDDSRLGSWFAVLHLLTHDFLFDLAQTVLTEEQLVTNEKAGRTEGASVVGSLGVFE